MVDSGTLDSISQVKELMDLSKEELVAKILQSKPLSFFKDLKELSDEQATPIYEGFATHWERIEKKISQANSAVESIVPSCKERGEYEPLADLVNKTSVAFEIKEDNEDRKIPYGYRLVIEATLLEALDKVLDIAIKTSKEFVPDKHNEDEEENKISHLRSLSLRLSDVFFDVSEKYLKSYLCLPW
ncbi:hypothetical protein Mgra_00005545 [Meloidogyne graminicola]|uniref:Uncharacterized protein n=1 Tax=Meloidogyne graminicola TaxID=189291 RepID=A0A8S9ZNV3_9BILA|nr:hypothetical protein Mgra_00005545 [Meloidogyne graminicola]